MSIISIIETYVFPVSMKQKYVMEQISARTYDDTEMESVIKSVFYQIQLIV